MFFSLFKSQWLVFHELWQFFCTIIVPTSYSGSFLSMGCAHRKFTFFLRFLVNNTFMPLAPCFFHENTNLVLLIFGEFLWLSDKKKRYDSSINFLSKKKLFEFRTIGDFCLFSPFLIVRYLSVDTKTVTRSKKLSFIDR